MNTYQKALNLNEQANEYAMQMRYSQAIIYYKDALSLYLALAKNNPSEHCLAIAHIFSNLAIVYLNLERFEMSEGFHENALKMHRALAKVNPNKYALELVLCLVDGVRYLKQHPFTLYEAEMAVNRVKKLEETDALLGIIRKLHAPALEQ